MDPRVDMHVHGGCVWSRSGALALGWRGARTRREYYFGASAQRPVIGPKASSPLMTFMTL
jgi:hypothetical protein